MLTRHCRSKTEKKSKIKFLFLKIHKFFKFLFVSAGLAIISKHAKFLTVQQPFQLSLPTGVIITAVSGFTKISRRVLDATTRNIKKRKLFLRLAGLRFQIIQSKFILFFKDFNFFQTHCFAQPRCFGKSIDAAYRRMGLWKWRCRPIWNLATKK